MSHLKSKGPPVHPQLAKQLHEENAKLRTTLERAREVIALCTTSRAKVPESTEVRMLGEKWGYGAVMSAASTEWAKMFDGTPQEGAQHTSGPSESTVKRTLKMIDEALGK